MASEGQAAIPVIQVDSEGYVTCPDCGAKKKCGTAGVENIMKNHRGTKICKDTQAKRDRNGKKMKEGSLLSFMQPRSTAVPSTVNAKPVQQDPQVEIPLASLSQLVSGSEKEKTRRKSVFVQELRRISMALPTTIPEATGTDLLSQFASPLQHDNPDLSADDLWEEVLNPFLKATLGWNAESDLEAVIWRGKLGFDAVVEFVAHFVEIRGVEEVLFEGKLAHLIECAKKTYITDITTLVVPPPSRIIIDIESETEEDPVEIFTPGARFAMEPVATKVGGSSMVSSCKGYIPDLPGRRSPHGAYPFAIHGSQNPPPWSYSVRGNVLALFADGCRGLCTGTTNCCNNCQDLGKNERLEEILNRMEYGVHENAPFIYHGIDGLIRLLQRKNEQIDFHKLKGLSQACSLLRKARALDNHKRFMTAIASGKIERVDRLIRIVLGQKKGIVAILELMNAAANGLYKPKSYSEKEAMMALVLLRLGGGQLAAFGHKALSLPSRSTRTIVPPIIPSYTVPSTIEVEENIVASFESVMDVVRAQGGVIHAVLMFDEIASEKRIRVDRKRDVFLGVCRQHGGKTSLKFVNEGDMEELFHSLDDDKAHYAAEATVGALGLLCDNNRIYPARVILISGDCKRETGEEHANVLQTSLDAVNRKREFINLRVSCLASDGEKRRGSAMVLLTFKNTLDSQSPIYELLSPLVFMDFHVGFDDLTPDKDWKHVFKRIRNLMLRERGIVIHHLQGGPIQGSRITPSILRVHLTAKGATPDHIRASFNPKDLQDVCIAFNLLKDVWSLPRTLSTSNLSNGHSPGFLHLREALWIFGKLLFHTVFPYVCVDLSLSEQLEHLSAAAHLYLLLFRCGGKNFIPTDLYVDLMIMIKNVYFCIAKAKVDNPLGSFWIILLGTDQLEELFGILRTMVGNDVNLDILQLAERISGTTEVANIFAKYLEWDHAPRRLKLPSLTRNSGEITAKFDHIKPSSWVGNVKLSNISLQTSWKRGRRLIETEFPEFSSIFKEMEAEKDITILAPSGMLLVNIPLPDDDIDKSLEEVLQPLPSQAVAPTTSRDTANIRVEVEDGLANKLAQVTSTDKSQSVKFQGQEMSKEKALRLYSKYRNTPGSMDRLKRVRGDERHLNSGVESYGTHSPNAININESGESDLIISDPVASLLQCDTCVWLCVGEVNGIKVDGRPVDCVDCDLLMEPTVSISYQILGLQPSDSQDDPTLKFDWRTYPIKEHTFTAPGRLIQPIDPNTSTPTSIKDQVFYLLDSRFLVALAASLFEGVRASDMKSIPKIGLGIEFPYRERLGKACFLCKKGALTGGVNEVNLDSGNFVKCPSCTSPSISLDLGKGPRLLEHFGAHILFDQNVDRMDEPCGLCLRPAALCHYYLKKGKGLKGKLKVDKDRTRSCLITSTFSYTVASTSTSSSPCSNVPLLCPLCSKLEPAVWRYNLNHHFSAAHPNADLKKYAHLWELSQFETDKMEEIWDARQLIVVKRPRKAKKTPLVISEAHRSHIPTSGSGKGKEREKAPLTSEDEGSDEGLEEKQSESESESDSDNPVDRNKACELSTPNVQSKTDSSGNVLTTDIHAPGLDCSESDGHSLQIGLDIPDESELDERTSNSTDMEVDAQGLGGGEPSAVVLDTASQASNGPTGRRERHKRNLILDDCLCGEQVDSSASNAIQCKRNGCETVWYHMSCLLLEQVQRNWVCEACVTSRGGRGGKIARR